jgi:hypothetical protein
LPTVFRSGFYCSVRRSVHGTLRDVSDLPPPPERPGSRWAKVLGFAAAGVIAVGVVVVAVTVRPVRRVVAAALVAALSWTGCEIVVGSYTERHCDAFAEAWAAQSVDVGDEVVALATPPEGEDVDPAVKTAALRIMTITLTDGPEQEEAAAVDDLLAACARAAGETGAATAGTGTTEPGPAIPAIDANCSEIQTAIDYYGEEHVFRTQLDDSLVEDTPADIRDLGVLLIRDLWSLCAFDVPQFAEDIADSLTEDSVRASVVREGLQSQDIHVFDEASDSAIDTLGRALCMTAKPLQPLSTAEIVGIAEDLVEDFGRMTTVEAGKVFFLTAPLYCPKLDVSG